MSENAKGMIDRSNPLMEKNHGVLSLEIVIGEKTIAMSNYPRVILGL